jgi:hypothetical protein
MNIGIHHGDTAGMTKGNPRGTAKTQMNHGGHGDHGERQRKVLFHSVHSVSSVVNAFDFRRARRVAVVNCFSRIERSLR